METCEDGANPSENPIKNNDDSDDGSRLIIADEDEDAGKHFF